jgi:hypothetical protein
MLTGKPIECYKPEGFVAYNRKGPDSREYQEVYRIGF